MVVVFFNNRNEQFNGKPISRFGLSPLVFTFVILCSLAAPFFIILASREKGPCLLPKPRPLFHYAQ